MKINKGYEQLKWEYLRRSEPYRKYCEWEQKKIKKKNLALPIPKIFLPTTGSIQNINPIVLTFLQYGDVHAQSFEEWFTVYYHKGKTLQFGSVDDLSVADYFMKNMFSNINNIFKRENNREPSLPEMAECLTSQMRMESWFQSYLKIRQAEFTADEARRLANEVYRLLMKRTSKSNNRQDELKRYLEVYDIWAANKDKKLTPIVRIKVQYYKNKYSVANTIRIANEYLSREIRRDLEKAKKIIANTENGIFPGKY